MSTLTSIEWTEMTWNPTTGCTKVSPGCQNCYAETMALRLKAMGVKGYENGFALTLQPSRLNDPLLRRIPSKYFVNSMSDMFHPEVPNEYIERVMDVIVSAPWHVFQILTKRPERMMAYFETHSVPQNAWLGVTVEDRNHVVPRMELLRRTRAGVRFVSMEPLLDDVGLLDLSGIRWVIVGGESGPRSRPMSIKWVLNIKKQCDEQGAEFFFKQWGGWGPDGVKRSKKANGRLLLGQTWDNVPKTRPRCVTA